MAILPGKRIRDNSIFGTLSASISSVGTSISSLDLADLSAISGDHAIITLDPFRQFGDPEIVMVTAHTLAGASATVQRGMYGTTARSHAAGVQWAHAATVEDYADVVTSGTLPADQYEGQLVYQTDTDSYRYFDGVTWRTLGAGSQSFLGYAEIIATTATLNPAETNVPGLSVTFTVPAGRRIKVSSMTHLRSTVSTDNLFVRIAEDGNEREFAFGNETGDDPCSPYIEATWSPTAGTHTVTIRAARQVGTGDITVFGNPTNPSWVLVEDITGTESPFAGSSVPVGMLAYAQVTTSQAALGTSAVLTGLSVNVVVPAGRTLRVTASGQFNNTVAGTHHRLDIREGATVLNTRHQSNAQITQYEHIITEAVFSPTAGSHTYFAQYVASGGSGTSFADADNKSFIMVEDITPTPTASSGAPSSTLGYAENLALSQSIVGASTADLSGLSVNVTVPAGRRLRITGHTYHTVTAGAPAAPFLQIMEGGTRLQLAQQYAGVAPDVNGSLECSVVISPTAGSHTYKLNAGADAGDTISFVSGSNFPAFILVEDITGSVWPAGSQVTSGIIASEAWTPFTPTLTQSGSVTFTNTYSRYLRLGRLIIAEVVLAITGAGTGGVKVSVGLPVNGVQDNVVCGSFHLVDASAVTNYTGVSFMEGTNTVIGVANAQGAGFGQASFTAALAAGDVVRYSVMYEAAS